MIKNFWQKYRKFNKEYSELKLPKKISREINIFSFIFLVLIFIPIILYLTTSFKIYNIFRIEFIIILIVSVYIFLIFYSYNEINTIKYLRSLHSENKEEFLNLLQKCNPDYNVNDLGVNELVDKINNVNLKKYWLFLFIESAFICSICLIIFYIILRKFFR